METEKLRISGGAWQACVLASSLLLAACVSGPTALGRAALPPGPYRSEAEARKPPSPRELDVVASAEALLGQKPNASVVVKGRTFTLDCIGTVSAIFYRVGIDVTKDFAMYAGNGVNRLYMTLRDQGVLHRDTYPRPGDVVVWDNTWDANGDGDRTDDPRTHAGVVIRVDDDGTIHYIHEDLSSGVVAEVMNLIEPTVAWDENGKRLNSGMAVATTAGGPKPEHWLSGEMFDAFGDVLSIAERLKVAANPALPDAIAMVDR